MLRPTDQTATSINRSFEFDAYAIATGSGCRVPTDIAFSEAVTLHTDPADQAWPSGQPLAPHPLPPPTPENRRFISLDDNALFGYRMSLKTSDVFGKPGAYRLSISMKLPNGRNVRSNSIAVTVSP